MAKQKGPAGVPNRHIYSRASYLYQAGQYLATASQAQDATKEQSASEKASNNRQASAAMNVSRLYMADMKAVSLKVLIRQSPAIKRSICKYCSTLQIEGKTCQSVVENASKGGKKPWADVLVIRCSVCQNVKRYPVDCPRQKRKHLRERPVEVSDKLEESCQEGQDQIEPQDTEMDTEKDAASG
jgi:ribonuclease P protein subunit RPR2